MSGGACQKAAQQANDVLAQQAKRDEDCGCGGGCAPAPALGKRDYARPKKGSNRRGPGCKNADCNACAEQADEVMNAVAGFSDGIPEFSFADVRRARVLAGMQRSLAVPQGSQGGAVPPPSTLDAGSITSCGGCSEDWDAMCAAEYGDAKASPSSGYNSWTASEGECTANLSCKDYSSLCDCQESEEATRWYCGTYQTSDGAYLYPAGKITCTYNASTGLCECEAVCPEEGYAWRTGSFEAAACGDGAVETRKGATVSCAGSRVAIPSHDYKVNEHERDDETAPAMTRPQIGHDLECRPTTEAGSAVPGGNKHADCVAQTFVMARMVSNGYCWRVANEGTTEVWRCVEGVFDAPHAGLGCYWLYKLTENCYATISFCCQGMEKCEEYLPPAGTGL